ncbi:M23 family metallopeptidase [Stenotrophomonas panacihumi]|uniref:M23 family metallopeptidase n=1 Tax=Stenotrophomonas panacihumi TaxID=676599 RepID=UPI0013795439|nr:M23 family metallopeptidase [Stenotrophomonas panacihumi]
MESDTSLRRCAARARDIPSTAAANPFDRNSDGKMDCWKDAAGPAGRRSTTRISSGPSSWRSGNWHHGIDLVSNTGNFGLGQPVRAIANGVVAKAMASVANGNFVQINHADGRASKYLHLKETVAKPGNHVSAGDVIGTMNCTGQCGTPRRQNIVQSTHVHIELQTSPQAERGHGTRLDPLTYLGQCP